MFNFFKKPKPLTHKKYALFNVDVFNAWFNDKENGATYANSGIFLRTDKLSESMIYEYLEKCHNVNLSEYDLSDDVRSFYDLIRQDWKTKTNKLNIN